MKNTLKFVPEKDRELYIIDELKKFTIERMTLNPNQSFEEVLEDFQTRNSHITTDKYITNTLHMWFNSIFKQQEIKKIISTQNFEEAIFHDFNTIEFSPNFVNSYKISLSEKDWQLSLESLSLQNNIAWNFSNPFASLKLEHNKTIYRVSLVHFSILNSNFSKVFIRRHNNNSYPLEMFINDESINVALLKKIVKDKKNVIICGSTGSGKTSLLKSLLTNISNESHCVTIQDVDELGMLSDNHSSLISEKNSNTSLTELCSYTLRMSPERIILGEIRGEEITPFILSSNSGHKGMMSTIHANNALDAINRLATLFCVYQTDIRINFEHISKIITESIDIIIYMENKKIKEIIKIIGKNNENIIYDKIV